MNALPQARLWLRNEAISSEQMRDRLLLRLKQAGIVAARVTFGDYLPEREDYLAAFRDVDVVLDTFPHPGVTTTCEALWMGVPVVSRAGSTHVSRVGVSLLSNVGLPELVAIDEKDYVRIAAELAADPARLAELRAGLRARMASSVLLDAPRFARNIEAAYREMWRKWCVE